VSILFKRKSILIAGIFLVVVGSIFLIFGLWYAWMYGISSDIPIEHLLFPEVSGNLLWLISVSCAMVVLGIIFILSAYKLKWLEKEERTGFGASKQSKNQIEFGRNISFEEFKCISGKSTFVSTWLPIRLGWFSNRSL